MKGHKNKECVYNKGNSQLNEEEAQSERNPSPAVGPVDDEYLDSLHASPTRSEKDQVERLICSFLFIFCCPVSF